MIDGEIGSRLAPGSDQAFHKAILKACAELYDKNRHMPVGETLTVQLTLTLDVLWATVKQTTPDANELLFRRLLTRLAKGTVRGEHLHHEGGRQ